MDLNIDVISVCRSHIAAANKVLLEILSVKDSRNSKNTLVPYNQLAIHLDSAGALAGLYSQVHPDEKVRLDAETCEKEISEFATELSLNKDLFKSIQELKSKELDLLELRLKEKLIRDFKRSGVDKDEKTRSRIRELNNQMIVIGQEFDRNVRDDVRFIELGSLSELDGLPQDYIEAHKPELNGKIKISTNYPDYIPFMSYAKSDKARERLAFEFKNRGFPKNSEVFLNLLQVRYELAHLLGYSNWAAYVTEDKMIKTSEAVSKFIDEIASISKPRAQAEYGELLAAKRKTNPSALKVEDWEKGFFELQVKFEKYAFDAKLAREYFEFTKVKNGLLSLTEELFGLRIKKISGASVWHASVEVYDLFDGSTQAPLGRMYLDLHPRSGKYQHAAQFTLRSGVADVQLPVGVLVCNFPEPISQNDPVLMEHSDVVTLFHEFGHLIHHILGGHQKWIQFSGVATEWDFVEAPSQFFEEWAWDVGVLQRFAHHTKTNEPIPAELVKKMRKANEFGQGYLSRQQMFYASLSLIYHVEDPHKMDPLKKLKELQEKYSSFPYQADTHFHLNFGHLNGYSAMYYTYMWSQVIAKDLLSPFKASSRGLMDLELARKYRKTILEAGGSKDAADLTKEFLGRPYSFDAFNKWLNKSSE